MDRRHHYNVDGTRRQVDSVGEGSSLLRASGTVLSITNLKDEDPRMSPSYDPETDRRCFRTLNTVLMTLLGDINSGGNKILVNCRAGINRSAALVCMVISSMQGTDFFAAIAYLEDKRRSASMDGDVVPQGYFRSFGGEYFRELLDTSAVKLRSQKRQTLQKSSDSPRVSYDSNTMGYSLKVLQQGQNLLYIGNLIAAKIGDYDVILDLTGTMGDQPEDNSVTMDFRDCIDALAILSSLGL